MTDICCLKCKSIKKGQIEKNTFWYMLKTSYLQQHDPMLSVNLLFFFKIKGAFHYPLRHLSLPFKGPFTTFLFKKKQIHAEHALWPFGSNGVCMYM